MQKRISILSGAACACLLAVAASSVSAADAVQDQVISSGSGVVLTGRDYEPFLRWLIKPEQRQSLLSNNDALRELAIDFHSDSALVKAAEDAGLLADPLVQARIEQVKRRVLVSSWIDKLTQAVEYPDFDGLALERYRAESDVFREPEMRKAAHIFIPHPLCECEAGEMQDDLTKVVIGLEAREPFEDLADRYSRDRESAADGGKIDIWIGLASGDVDPAFRKALFDIEAEGDVSDPVETEYGVHVIKLTAIKPERLVPFEEAKPAILNTLKKEYVQSMIATEQAKSMPDPNGINVGALRDLVQDVLDQRLESDVSGEGNVR